MINYLPKSFDDIVGLSYVKKSLSNYDYNDPVPIMFVGERGSGKTSLVHIMASEFGASYESIRDINCGVISKIEDMRKEIDLLSRSSIFGEKKVLILDEVHILNRSKPSQEAWLRPLDPDNLNKNVLILACTTNVEKLLPTFLRRFVQYKVVPLSNQETKIFIDKVCKTNNVELSKIARTLIIEKCDGIPGEILNGIRKLVGVDDIEEAKYLLELVSLKEDIDLLDFIKLLTSKEVNWDMVRSQLKDLLKEKQPNEIKIGLLNLITSRMMSDYFKPKNNYESTALQLLYLLLNKASDNFLVKQNLIYALFTFTSKIKGE